MTGGRRGRDDPSDDARVRAAVSDVYPTPFRERIDRRLRGSAVTAGRLTRLAARVPDRDAAPEEIDRRAVGVQSIYEGLKLTRRIARFPPWADDSKANADLDILVAEVLVARGFSLLAPTEASPEAVEAIRAFGRAETNRRTDPGDWDPCEHDLEADVFALGIVAGVTATGAERPDRIHGFTAKLAGSPDDDFDDCTFERSGSIAEELHTLVAGDDS